MSNLPDDWDQYWATCPLCGKKYHMSEYGCSCTEEVEDCGCGENDWTTDEVGLICRRCKTRPGEEPIKEDEDE